MTYINYSFIIGYWLKVRLSNNFLAFLNRTIY